MDGYYEVWLKYINFYRKFYRRKGVYLALEPLNRFETDFINIVDDALRLVEDVGSNRLKIHLDAFHMNIEEKNSAEAIRKAGKLLYNFHANENDRGAIEEILAKHM